MTSKATLGRFEALEPLRQHILEHGGGVRFLVAGTVTFLCVLWTYKSVGIVYGIIDDKAFEAIVSGSYSGTPDGHLVYLKYVLGWAISRLYTINNHFDWYGLSMLGLLYLCLFLIMLRALELAGTFWKQVRATALVVAAYVVLGLQHFAEFQFTTVAAVLAGTGIFWLYTSDPATVRRRTIDYATVVLLFLTGFMVRADSFLLSVPFAGIVYVHKNMDWRRALRLRQATLPVAVLMGIGAILLIEQLAYSDPAWKAFLHFNDLDTQLYDYCGVPAYDTHQRLYRSIGVSRETYELLRQWVFTVHDAGNSKTFGAIVDDCLARRGSMLRLPTASSRTGQIALDLLHNVSGPAFALTNIAWFVLGAFVLAAWKSTFTYRDALFLLAFAGVHFGEWCYLVFIGRYPDRVVWAIYLIELLVLAALVMRSRDPRQALAPKSFRLTVSLLAAVMLLAAVCYQSGVVREQVGRQRGRNSAFEKADAYTARHPRSFYFLAPGPSTGATQTFKVRADNRLHNYTSLGGWTFFSPVLLQNWSRHGITDVKHDLIERDDVFLLVTRVDSLQDLVDFYHSISVNAVATEVDRIGTGGQGAEVRVFQLHVLEDPHAR